MNKTRKLSEREQEVQYKEMEEKKNTANAQMATFGLFSSSECEKTWDIELEADNVLMQFSDVKGSYAVQNICHELVRICNELRITGNTLTVTETTEKDTI
jgi:hypothetical protein